MLWLMLTFSPSAIAYTPPRMRARIFRVFEECFLICFVGKQISSLVNRHRNSLVTFDRCLIVQVAYDIITASDTIFSNSAILPTKAS